MTIIKETSYLVPEGEFPGTITSARLIQDEKNGKTRESIRHTIDLDPIPDEPMYDFKARMDYWETQVSDFVRDAKKLLGGQANALISRDGEIDPDKLSLFEGKRVKFHVVHERRPGHKNAFRKIVNIRPEQEAA